MISKYKHFEKNKYEIFILDFFFLSNNRYHKKPKILCSSPFCMTAYLFNLTQPASNLPETYLNTPTQQIAFSVFIVFSKYEMTFLSVLAQNGSYLKYHINLHKIITSFLSFPSFFAPLYYIASFNLCNVALVFVTILHVVAVGRVYKCLDESLCCCSCMFNCC